ncbi:LAMI_0E10154g1_1 [Lachancea mirantina]|uniref:Mediator of RNA polymerase II transcription subunit 1 n=1 Tax=Lachancea mirantina TaxID=1230905 RepID=A0A1G4JNU4_9SACH|nr:LAMI_0E10154g1_1 [Lachancea mirantina]
MGDAYVDGLDRMITLFRDYKPGIVSIENVTRLCQTLGLESFIDDVNNETHRLSTASKIIVVDMDFSKSDKKIKDVKLVLASNFDNFNYYENGEGGNILFNSLNQYGDLAVFHHNLKFLSLLDTYSSIDLEHSISNRGTTFDLFKYFTELAGHLEACLKQNGLGNFEVLTNVNNEFGIYFQYDGAILGKIVFEEAQDPEQRLSEFKYEDSEWVNVHSQRLTRGVCLAFTVISDDIQFPCDTIPTEIVLDGDSGRPFQVTNNCRTVELHNDFTSDLTSIRKFDVSNENMELLSQLLLWIDWWKKVLCPLFKLLHGSQIVPQPRPFERRSSSTSTSSSLPRRSSISKRRRSSAKGKGPLAAESTILKDEGMQEFTLHEILEQPVVEDEPEDVIELVINEDYLQCDGLGSCTIDEDRTSWNSFITKLASKIGS